MLFRNLKDVEIDLITQGKNELTLIKYLLDYAKNLQKMTVLYASPLQSNISREIIKYKVASNANAEVNFYQV